MSVHPISSVDEMQRLAVEELGNCHPTDLRLADIATIDNHE